MIDIEKSEIEGMSDLEYFIWVRCEADNTKTNEIMQAIKSHLNQEINKVLDEVKLEKKKVSDYEMNYLNLPMCKECNEPYGDLNKRLIYNEAVDELQTIIERLRG